MDTLPSNESEIARLEEAVGAFADAIRAVVDCDSIFVFGLDQSGDIIVSVAQAGIYGDFPIPVIHRSQGITGRALEEQRFLATDDYARLDYRRLRGMVLGIRSLFVVPLLRDDRAYGLVMGVAREASGFTLRETELTRLVGSVPVTCSEAIGILGEIRFQRTQYYALQRLVRANSERHPLEIACADLSEIVAEAVGADYMVVGRRTIEGTTTYHGCYGTTTPTWHQGMIAYSPLAIDHETAVASGETVVVDLTTVDANNDAFAQSKAEGAKVLVIVPIIARGARIGALLAGWRVPVVPPRRVLDLLETFAAQASVAVTDEWRKDDAGVRADLEIARATNRSAAAELHAMLATDSLGLVYQPIFDLATGRVVEIEALSRWPGAPGPFTDPELFVRLAEEYGAIGQLTDRIIYRALRDLPHLPSDVRIAINISMVNLLQIDFAKRLLRILSVAGVAPSRFAIELTETASIVDREVGSESVGELARAGVGVSIDDFGEGYSALSYLKLFPATTIKIHRRYVANVQADAYDNAIVRALVDLAHRINIVVVAEGVEDSGVLDALRAIGCDRVQGYVCAGPMPIGDLRAFLASPEANITALGSHAPGISASAPST